MTTVSKEEIAVVEFWLSPENAKALSQLREKQPELGAFVDKLRQMIDEKTAIAQKAQQVVVE